MKNVILGAAFGIFFTGCALPLPLHEGHPPAAVGQGAFRVASGFAQDPQESLVAVPESTVSPSEPIEALGTMYISITAGILDRLDAFVELDSSIPQGGGYKLGLRFQFLGEPTFKTKSGDLQASVALRYFHMGGKDFQTSVDLFNMSKTDVYYDTLKANGAELAPAVGFAVQDWFIPYGGFKYVYAQLDGTYHVGSRSAAVETGKRSINGYGPFVGINLFPHKKSVGLEIIVEFFGLRMPATYRNEMIWTWGWGTTFGVPFQVF
jgi:hypothetical protein